MQHVTGSTKDSFPGAPRTCALVGAVVTWQQRQERGEELLGCPSQCFAAWLKLCLGQPAHSILK
eukprot:scaffold79604_cov18-Tisochrysis_lutea.AAC.1